MYLAHLPSGYLLGKFLQNKLKVDKYLPYSLIGSIAPDFDLIYAEIVNYPYDHRYLPTHTLFAWLAGLLLFLMLRKLLSLKLDIKVLIFFFSGVLTHLILDTIVGEIMWLYPFNRTFFGILKLRENFYWVVLAEFLVIFPSIWLLYKNFQAYKKKQKEKIYQVN